ncbi:hypothetical protein Tco_1562966 [Tanacetum coccineum]
MSQPANDVFSQKSHSVIPQTTVISNIKLPILKKEEYAIWVMEMENYLECIDNDVWKVIQNGNSKKRISTRKDGVIRILPPVTAAKIQAVEKERKAKNILTSLVGNANSKKMQKAVFKQQFKAFTISSSEGLEKGYDRFQQLLSQLEAHGAEVSIEDANHNKSSTNKVKSGFTSAYSTGTLSTSSTNILEKEALAGFADEVIYSLFAKQSED